MDKKWFQLLSIVLMCILFSLISQPSLADLDYTLQIYGNANEDQDINQEDIAYLQEIIDDMKDKTKLADANNDGAINQQDIDQVDLLMKGDASFIVVLDSEGEPLKISLPVESIIPLNAMIDEQIQAIGQKNKIIGIDEATSHEKHLLPEISSMPVVGTEAEPDLEKIASLKPDLVIDIEWIDEEVKQKMKKIGLNVLSLPFHGPLLESIGSVKTLGYILGNQEKSKEYTDWYSQYLEQIQGKTSDLSENEKPKIAFLAGSSDGLLSGGSECPLNEWLEFAGTKNIGESIPGNYVDIDPEYVIEADPQYIIVDSGYPVSHGYTGYESNSAVDEESISKLSTLAGFDSLDAVQNNKVYSMTNRISTYTPWLGELYLAKLIHPELFSDLDPRAIHEEYLQKYLNNNFDVYNNGLFLYPIPEEWPDKKPS